MRIKTSQGDILFPACDDLSETQQQKFSFVDFSSTFVCVIVKITTFYRRTARC